MTRRIATLALLAVFVPRVGTTAEDIVIWKEFVRTLREGKLTEDRIRPYYEQFKQPLLGFLTSIPAKAKPEDWEKLPEIHRVDDQLHFLIPLTANGKKVTYCFTLLAEGDKWYFQHLESISIRLDKLEPLPAERFPDLREGQKNWIRQEWHVSQQIRLFNFLAKEKGKPFAFNWFKDGAGYFLAART